MVFLILIALSKHLFYPLVFYRFHTYFLFLSLNRFVENPSEVSIPYWLLSVSVFFLFLFALYGIFFSKLKYEAYEVNGIYRLSSWFMSTKIEAQYG